MKITEYAMLTARQCEELGLQKWTNDARGSTTTSETGTKRRGAYDHDTSHRIRTYPTQGTI
jgi:hypothetical protein